MPHLCTDFADWVERARVDPDLYWGEVAAQLPWTTTWTSVYEGEPPSYRWFAGGRTNLGANCVDRHASGPNAGRVALAYRNERGDAVDVTYAELDRRVRQASAALRGVGVGHGDRVTLYMPPCVESIVMMLACARIGAIHCVVFAGFGSGALADRIDASGSHWLFTVDSTYRRGSDVDLTKIVDEALEVVGDKLDRVVPVVGEAGRSSSPRGRARTTPPSRWRRTSRRSSSPPPARPRARSSWCTPTAATRSRCTTAGTSATGSTATTCGGRRPTSAGSSGTATSSTRRCWSGRPRWCTRARSTTPPQTCCGA